MLIDSHCHLDYAARAGKLDDVLGRAKQAGITGMLTISTRLDQSGEAALAIAKRHDNIWCSLGVHPLEAGQHPSFTLQELIDRSHHPKIVAIGEAGLDYTLGDMCKRDEQKAIFYTQIKAACATHLPIVIHARAADDDMATMLEEASSHGYFKGVMHCFSSGRDLASYALAIGLYISFSGILTFKKSHDLRSIAQIVPEDRLLVETDSPYLAPEPVRGQSNEPSNLIYTLKCLADLRACDPDTMAAITTNNFYRLFTKSKAVQNLIADG